MYTHQVQFTIILIIIKHGTNFKIATLPYKKLATGQPGYLQTDMTYNSFFSIFSLKRNPLQQFWCLTEPMAYQWICFREPLVMSKLEAKGHNRGRAPSHHPLHDLIPLIKISHSQMGLHLTYPYQLPLRKTARCKRDFVPCCISKKLQVR